MFKHYFETIKDIDFYPVISLLIFFIFFVVLIAWVVKMDRKYIKRMESLPLEGENDPLNKYDGKI